MGDRMNCDSFTWFSDPSPASEEQIAAVEIELGHRFPEDYREFAKLYSGGSPNETDFEFRDSDGEIFFASLGEFFTLLRDHEQNLVSWMRRTESFPSDLIPFAVDGGGNYICLDYRAAREPLISFWHAGRRGMDDEISFVANSFSDFVGLLHEPDDET